MLSNKVVKLLESRMSQGLKNPKIIGQRPQGNGHVTLDIRASGREVTVRGVSCTPNDWTFTGNKLRQQVKRLLAES